VPTSGEVGIPEKHRRRANMSARRVSPSWRRTERRIAPYCIRSASTRPIARNDAMMIAAMTATSRRTPGAAVGWIVSPGRRLLHSLHLD
jgi:hypothetical protein